MEHRIMKEYPRYKVFEDGSIQSLDGFVYKLDINDGYYRMSFGNHEGKKNLRIARVVAHLWYGLDLYDLTLEPDHLDSNRLNNHWTNLEVVTKSENCRRRSGRQNNSCIDTETHKECSKCLNLQPREGFAKKKNSVDGLGSWCKDCTLAYRREYSKQRRLNNT